MLYLAPFVSGIWNLNSLYFFSKKNIELHYLVIHWDIFFFFLVGGRGVIYIFGFFVSEISNLFCSFNCLHLFRLSHIIYAANNFRSKIFAA